MLQTNLGSTSKTAMGINMNETSIFNATENPLAIYEAACYEKWNNTPPLYSNDTLYCPRIWDSWNCWPDTLAGHTVYEVCPHFIMGFDTSRYAHKYCDEAGEWYRHPTTNTTWSNYTTCFDFDIFEFHQGMNIFSVIGYSISLMAILLSLAILTYFRSLKCARITLHMNLFVTYAGNNFLWIIWLSTIIRDAQLLNENNFGCILLRIMIHYFMLTNYACMLCEGFYLHTVLVSAFVSEQKLVRWLIALCWSLPALIILIYSLARFYNPLSHEFCWMNDEVPENHVLSVPVVTSIILNLIFLCNIVRVLLLKLRAPAGPQSNRPSNTVIQAFRATLLLVPLLGIQYILLPSRPEQGEPGHKLYLVILAITSSLQGLCVAILFCFCNGEVLAQIKRKYRTMFYSNRPRSNSYTATQVSTEDDEFDLDIKNVREEDLMKLKFNKDIVE